MGVGFGAFWSFNYYSEN